MSTKTVKVTNNGGIGFLGLLTIVFITLKLTGYIAWSWWWVLAPLWVPFAMFLSFSVIAFIIALIVTQPKKFR